MTFVGTPTKLAVAGTTVHVLVGAEPRAGEPALWPSIGEYPCYDADLYGTLTGDEVRNERFRAALRRLAPRRTVVDIGTGQDLIWAREAHAAGARSVVAVEAMPESSRLAASRLAELGLDGEVTLLSGRSTDVSIGPLADVCVGEIIGSVAGAEGAAAIFADARRRLMTAEGRIIPDRCRTLAAAARLEDVLGGAVAFAPSATKYLTTIFESNGGPMDVRLRIRDPIASALVSDSAVVEDLDLNGVIRVEQSNTATLTVTRDGLVDGLLTWLEIACLPDEKPLDALRDRTSWATVFFPLFDEPIGVTAGDEIRLTFIARPGDDGVHPDYAIEATVCASGVRHRATHLSRHHGGGFRRQRVYRQLFPPAPTT